MHYEIHRIYGSQINSTILLPEKRCDRVITGSNGVPQRAVDVWPVVIRVIDGLCECACVRVIPRKLIE